jgi:hypothetical protein
VFVTDTWTLVQIAWSDFTDGVGTDNTSVTATGDEVAGITLLVYLEWEEDPPGSDDWTPVPAAYGLVIDDISFY